MAEDNLVNQRLAAALLKKLGWEATLANNGAEAVAAVQRDRFDAVLMDVEMPVMNGIEAARCLFAKYSHPNVILMTGYATADIVPEDLRQLCSVLQKPFSSQALMEAVRKMP